MKLSVIEYSILLECREFLSECNGIPLYKSFNSCSELEFKSHQKVKIRSKNVSSAYDDIIDDIIDDIVEYKNFKNRSLVTTTVRPIDEINSYYVFIPDSFKCMNVKPGIDSNIGETYDLIDSSVDNIQLTIDNLFAYSYEYGNLSKAIQYDNDIIFYNIPYYYCIKIDKPFNEVIKFYDNI